MRDDISAPSTTVQEQWQDAFEGRLRGRADVIRRGAEPEIEDYKTGSLYEDDGEEMKAQYRLQLLLYAVLEHATSGVWPRRAILVPLEGQPATIEINATEASEAAASALRALDEYNAAIDNVRPLEKIASPSADRCRFCPFSIQCPAFWSAVEPAWAEDGIIALAGHIERREESRLSTFTLTVRRESGSVSDGNYLVHQLDAERFHELRIAPIGASVALVDLIGEVDRFHLKASTRTRAQVADG